MSQIITFEPLSIECSCPGDPGAVCELTALRFDWEASMDPTVTASVLSIDLPCGTGVIGGGNGSGTYFLDIDCNHSSGTLSYYFGRSLSSDDYGMATVAISGVATFTCVTGDVVETYEKEFGLIATGNRSVCAGATGSDSLTYLSGQIAIGIVLRSRPLGCTDDASQSISVDLEVDDSTSIHFGSGSCFCASGGTTITTDDPPSVVGPIYQYVILDGRLPEGLTLHPVTGCVLGEKVDGGDPGTDKLTIKVTDYFSNESATVECGYIVPGCASGETRAPANSFR